MKTIILLGDGMADYPIPELDNKTPLEAAHTPHLDRLASLGTLGMVHTVKNGFPPGSDVANMTVLGLDVARAYSGRAPIEAMSIGVDLAGDDTAFRINTVTLTQQDGALVMEDYCAGHITTEEAGKLIETLKPILAKLGNISVYRGVEYRHLMVVSGYDNPQLVTTPPHDIIGQPVQDFLPDDVLLRRIITESMQILASHPVNQARKARGLRPATSLWPWGQGKALKTRTLQDEFGLSGAMISAVDLCKGLGIMRGMEVINVPGATGWIDTNYTGKAQAALQALEHHDLVYLHVEAPDEAGHGGLLKEKIQAIEDIDSKVLGAMLPVLDKGKEPYRILCMPDHPTPICKRTHTSDAVPFLVYENTRPQAHPGARFTEKDAQAAGLIIEEGHTLLNRILSGKL